MKSNKSKKCIMHLSHIHHETDRVQTLKEHSTAVSKLCRKYGESVGFPHLAQLCGLLHDAGKAKQEFQNYLCLNDPEEQRKLKGKIIHSTAGGKYIFETYGHSKNPLEKYTAQIIALVILSHHSSLIDCIDIQGLDEFSRRLNPEKERKEIYYYESIDNFLKECTSHSELDELFRKTTSEVEHFVNKLFPRKDIENKEKLIQFYFLSRYILSCVIDADRFDAYCFASSLETNDTTFPLSDIWDDFSIKLEKHLKKSLSQRNIDLLRSEISDSCKISALSATKAGGIYRLRVPTGGGKTLASLRYSLILAQKFQKKRIFYVIPFTTIIDQNAKVMKEILAHDLVKDNYILEHHSNIVTEGMENETDQGNVQKLLTERWDSPLILTTVVQMLNTLFLGKSQSVRRMHNLAESVIIFDEVQAIPIKCLSMFNAAMNFLSEYCGTTIILCTATQPELVDVPIPIRLSEPNEMVPDYEVKYQQFRRTHIVDSTNETHSAETLASFVLDKTKHNSTVLVIMNTKLAARKLYEELQMQVKSQDELNEEDLYYLSTNLCPAHRMEKLSEIIFKLEKNKKLGKGEREERAICVSTQLIEAGVDVSFDCVIRSLAGLDSIAQAAGRCNRHGEDEIKNVYVISCSDENLSHLPDIKNGQIQTKRLFHEYEKYPEFFEKDLLSPSAIQRYYEYYFHEQQDNMNYPISKKDVSAENVTLVDLLTLNQVGLNAYLGRNKNNKPPYYLPQAFSTAGNFFEVIDSNTISVIVPHGDGKKIIEELHTETYLPMIFKLTKRAQQFSVNLFSHERDNLGTGVYQIKETGIFALDISCYSAEYGVTSPSGDTLYIY